MNFLWTFRYYDTPVFTVFAVDNGSSQSVYQHLSCTFVVVYPRWESTNIALFLSYWNISPLLTCTEWLFVLTQHSGGGWKYCLQPCEKPRVPVRPPHMYHDLQRELHQKLVRVIREINVTKQLCLTFPCICVCVFFSKVGIFQPRLCTVVAGPVQRGIALAVC